MQVRRAALQTLLQQQQQHGKKVFQVKVAQPSLRRTAFISNAVVMCCNNLQLPFAPERTGACACAWASEVTGMELVVVGEDQRTEENGRTRRNFDGARRKIEPEIKKKKQNALNWSGGSL